MIKYIYLNYSLTILVHSILTIPSPFIKNMLTNSFPSVKVGIDGDNFLIQETNERDLIKGFIIRQLVKDEDSIGGKEYKDTIEQTLFSELVEGFEGDDVWLKTKVWKCAKAECPSEVIGCIGAYPLKDNRNDTPEIYVSFFYVDKAFQGRGVGGYIWRHMFDWIQNSIFPFHEYPNYRTINLITIKTIKDVYVKAYEFYLKEGFKEFPSDYPASDEFTSVKMVKVFELANT